MPEPKSELLEQREHEDFLLTCCLEERKTLEASLNQGCPQTWEGQKIWTHSSPYQSGALKLVPTSYKSDPTLLQFHQRERDSSIVDLGARSSSIHYGVALSRGATPYKTPWGKKGKMRCGGAFLPLALGICPLLPLASWLLGQLKLSGISSSDMLFCSKEEGTKAWSTCSASTITILE